MTGLDKLAAFVCHLDPSAVPWDVLDGTALHVLDTLGALLAGAGTPEGEVIGEFVASESDPAGFVVPGYRDRAGLGTAVVAACAATRCTEMDDIHLASCTTPGSVVVPTALALVSAGRLPTPPEFFGAVLAGYDLLVRLGKAAGGPALLAQGLWPTSLAAPLGSAAVAARAYGLDTADTAGALATALALSSGTAIRPAGATTSRWLTLGAAAQSGVRAVEWARLGIRGNPDLLEERHFRIGAVPVSREDLLAGLGTTFEIAEVGFKPYPGARQGLAAVEACRDLVREQRLDPCAVDEIIVRVPGAQRAVIDRPALPTTRMASLVSVQYQVALALTAPERLHDTRRCPVFVDDRLQRMMARVRVESAPELEPRFPAAWPATCELRVGARRFVKEVLRPAGDPGTGFGWEAVTDKLRRAGIPGRSDLHLERMAERVRTLATLTEMPRLWE